MPWRLSEAYKGNFTYASWGVRNSFVSGDSLKADSRSNAKPRGTDNDPIPMALFHH